MIHSCDDVIVIAKGHTVAQGSPQQLCQRTGATLRWFGVTPEGRLDLSPADELISDRTKIVAITHQSNVTGTVPPVTEIAALAHDPAQTIVVSCAGRTRGILGAQCLRDLGYRNAYALLNGAMGWRLAGYELEEGTGRGLWGKNSTRTIRRLRAEWSR